MTHNILHLNKYVDISLQFCWYSWEISSIFLKYIFFPHFQVNSFWLSATYNDWIEFCIHFLPFLPATQQLTAPVCQHQQQHVTRYIHRYVTCTPRAVQPKKSNLITCLGILIITYIWKMTLFLLLLYILRCVSTLFVYFFCLA